MQFALLSDVNAADFVNVSTVPLFRDPSAGRTAWCRMEPGAVKHDTFVFSAAGRRTLFWDTSERSLAAWNSDIRQAVEALGK